MLCKAEWPFCARAREVLTSGLCSWRLVLSHAAKRGMGNSIGGNRLSMYLSHKEYWSYHGRKLAILHPNFTEISDWSILWPEHPMSALKYCGFRRGWFWAIVRKLPDASWSGERDRSPSMGPDPIGTSSDSDPRQYCSQPRARILAPSTILTGIVLDQLAAWWAV